MKDINKTFGDIIDSIIYWNKNKDIKRKMCIYKYDYEKLTLEIVFMGKSYILNIKNEEYNND